jgi:hypothetical protein
MVNGQVNLSEFMEAILLFEDREQQHAMLMKLITLYPVFLLATIFAASQQESPLHRKRYTALIILIILINANTDTNAKQE